jgi:hypothetical protein
MVVAAPLLAAVLLLHVPLWRCDQLLN